MSCKVKVTELILNGKGEPFGVLTEEVEFLGQHTGTGYYMFSKQYDGQFAVAPQHLLSMEVLS